MADLGDAYSEFTGGSEYTMPTGSEGLSSYGQRLYGQPRVAQAPINTDLQTQLFGLKMEQQKSSAVRQMRDTALASLNLREQNRIEEQAGYAASVLGDLDPYSDNFEDSVTNLYAQLPYAFRDQAINKAVDYKRDIRKQYDSLQRNMQTMDTRAAAMELKQRADTLRKEDNGMYSGLLNDYYSLPADAPVERQREALLKAEDVATKSRLASSLAAYGVAGTEEQILKKYSTTDGVFDIGAANKDLKRRVSLDKRLKELDPMIKEYARREETGFPVLTEAEEKEYQELRNFRASTRRELLGMSEAPESKPQKAALNPQLQAFQNSITQYNDWYSKWGTNPNIPEPEKVRGAQIKSSLEKAAAPINMKSPGNAASLEEKQAFVDMLRSIPTEGVSVQFKLDGKPTKWVKARRDLLDSLGRKKQETE